MQDDGKKFMANASGKEYGPTWKTNDVIGVGIEHGPSNLFFTM